MFVESNSLESLKQAVKDTPATIIIPPSPFLADERALPSLGPLRVASELRKNGNYVEVLDLSGVRNYEDITAEYAQTKGIKNFGITATTPQLPAAAKIRDRLIESVIEPNIILGGPHVTLTHAAYMRDLKIHQEGRGKLAFEQLKSNFNKLVVGDGEIAIFQALAENSPAVIEADNRYSNLFLQRGTLDNYAFPARDLIDLDSYHFSVDGKRAFSVIGQLGCPFECGFCGGRDSQSFRLTRTRSVGNVIDEIESVIKDPRNKESGYEAVMFYDDELNVNKGSLEKLCTELTRLQDKLGLEMRFRGFVKAELFTEEQAKLMYQAGFRVLLSGVESGSDLMLKTMKKHTTADINKRALEISQKAGLKFKALMSLGHPGESEETISQSIKWILNNKPDDVDWTIITEYPGSPYFDHSTYDDTTSAWIYTEPSTGNRLWSSSVDYVKDAEYYKGIPGKYSSYVWTDYLSSLQLVELRDAAEQITRPKLGLSPILITQPTSYEHSMGQSLPNNILRHT